MNLENLKQILIDSKIFIKEKSKNYSCICPFCGDHPDPKKKGHFNVSKQQNLPVAHCWYCGHSTSIVKLIKDLTGNPNKYKEVISEEELAESQKKQKPVSSHKKRFEEFKVPVLNCESFSSKRLYIRKRTNNQIEINKISGLVFNFLEFFHINHLDLVGEGKQLSNFEVDMLQQNFVGFLGEHNTILYCRSIDDNSKYKFKKVILQNDSYSLLEYWAIKFEDPSRNKNSEKDFKKKEADLLEKIGRLTVELDWLKKKVGIEL